MFKRIMKISGIVLLAFVLIVGGVVAFMAIRGDFKKQIIKPTAISFSIEETELLFDVSVDADSVNSFIIKSEPAEITENECTIKLSDTSLIRFVTLVDGVWKEYTSNTFYLNRPIYFQVKDVKADNVDAYTDGILTITVTDKTGLLHTKLELEIDRTVTSVSFKDQYNEDNNKITDGLFAYENTYGGTDSFRLQAVIKQAYPLEFISAPLKAEKPFAGKEAKVSEIYYIENNHSKQLTHDDEEVKLKSYDNNGDEVYEDCEFLTYDMQTGNYMLYSENSGKYEFMLAMYPTYAVQDEVLNGEYSQSQRLENMITKTVIVDVTGTEASTISFAYQDVQASLEMKLFGDNRFTVNDPLAVGMSSLGLTLSKGHGVEITGRYGELKLLSDIDYTRAINWSMKNIEGDIESAFKLNLYDLNGEYVAEIVDNGSIPIWVGSPRYKAVITKGAAANAYVLTLTHSAQQAIDGKYKKIEIEIPLIADDVAGSTLALHVDATTKMAEILVEQFNSDDGITYGEPTTSTTHYWKFESGSIMIVEDTSTGSEPVYALKSINDGIYIMMLDKDKKYINNDFVSSLDIDHSDGGKSIITIKPIKDYGNVQVDMYAIVVNSDNTWAYTDDSYEVTINAGSTDFKLNSTTLQLPVKVLEKDFDWGSNIDVDNMVDIDGTYAEAGYLMFVPEYDYINLTEKPADWGNGTGFYTYNEVTKEYKIIETAQEFNGKYYYRKIANKFECLNNIYITRADGIKCYLMGYFDGAGKFNNVVKPTGLNYNSRIYFAIPKVEYLGDGNRLQHADEYVEYLMRECEENYVAATVAGNNIEYDRSLLTGRKVIWNQGFQAITPAGNVYSEHADYYTKSATGYSLVEVPEEDINNWVTRYGHYYEKRTVNVIDAKGSTYITTANYYAVSGGLYLPAEATYDASTNLVTNSVYLLVDHYNITGVEYKDDYTKVTITAKASVYGHAFGNEIRFENIVLTPTEIKLDSDVAKYDFAKYIVANSYYQLGDEADDSIEAAFGGEYFTNTNNPNKPNGDRYPIVAEHSSIAVDWDGNNTDRLVKDQIASAILMINHQSAETVLRDILPKIKVRVVEYDSNDILQSSANNSISVGDCTIEYVPANKYVDGLKYYTVNSYNELAADAEYELKTQYYKLFNGKYYKYNVPTGISAADWAELREELYTATYDSGNTYDGAAFNANKDILYVKAIVADFTADNVLNYEYAKLMWTYTAGGKEMVIANSPKLLVLSCMPTGYIIDASIDTTKHVKAKLVTEENKTTEWVVGEKYYQLGDGGLFDSPIIATDANYEDGYYRILNVEEEDVNNISYLIMAGWDNYTNDYKYTAYAADAEGNLFVEFMPEDCGYAITLDAKNAFNIGIVDAGGAIINRWLKPVPAYAKYHTFSIDSSHSSLEFENIDGDYIISSAHISDNYGNLTVRSVNNSDAKLTINVKVAQSNFTLNNDASGVSYKPTAEKPIIKTSALERSINNGTYKHHGVDITKYLKISISDVSTECKDYYVVENLQDKVISNDGTEYTIIEKNGDSSKKVTLKYGVDTGWIFTRSSSEEISFDIKIDSIFGVQTITLDFDSPWKIKPNSNNATSDTLTIYSGTKFRLADVVTEDDNEDLGSSDPLFKLIEVHQDFEVAYYPSGTNIEPVIVSVDSNAITFNVPNVNAPTDYSFEIRYKPSGEIIHQFALKVKPNVVITNMAIDTKLNDYNKTSVNLSQLGLKAYKNETYVAYKEPTEAITTNLQYSVTTYVDDKFTTTYTCNLASIDSGRSILAVDSTPIGELGTYYLLVGIEYTDTQGTTDPTDDVKVELNALEFTVDTLSELDYHYNNNIEATVDKNDTAIFNSVLNRNGERAWYYSATSGYVAGNTYVKNGNTYTAVEKEEDFDSTKENYIIKNSVLDDMFWINYQDENLSIKYHYEDNLSTSTGLGSSKLNYILTQSVEKQDNGEHNYYLDVHCTQKDGAAFNATSKDDRSNVAEAKFKLVGTTLGNGNPFNISDNTFAYGDTRHEGPVYYALHDDKLYMHCTQNAYLFELKGDAVLGDLYMALVTVEGGKRIYLFDPSKTDIDEVCFRTISLAGFSGLTYTYAEHVTEDTNVEFKAEPIFRVADNKVVRIKDSSMEAELNISRHMPTVRTNTLLSGYDYTLEQLFNIDTTKLKNIEFDGTGKGYSIITRTGISYINTVASGNSFKISVPIKLTYNSTETKIYKTVVEFTVVNSTQVEINHPFAVSDDDHSAYSLFNSSLSGNIGSGTAMDKNGVISAITNAHELYVDIGAKLGNNTTAVDWDKNATMPFDIVLRGDKIQLDKDELLNITRYKAFTYQILTNQAYAKDTFYKYDTTTNQFVLLTNVDAPDDWGTNKAKYYVKNSKTSVPSSVELVAVGNSYNNILANVTSNIDIVDGNRAITFGSGINGTGYVVFKITDDSGAYGYYIVKVLADNRVKAVFNTVDTIRRTLTNKNQVKPTTSDTVVNFITTGGVPVYTLGNIDQQLVNSDLSNVHFFMVDSEVIDAAAGDKVEFKLNGSNVSFAPGELIPSVTIVQPKLKVQILTIAAVLYYEGNLVYVGNYELVLSPNVAISISTNPGDKYREIEGRELYYEYERSENYAANTTCTDEEYSLPTFAVDLKTGPLGATKVSLDTVVFEKIMVGNDITNNSTELLYNGTKVVSVTTSTNAQKLILHKPLSQDIQFRLKYTYKDNCATPNYFSLYVTVGVNAYQFSIDDNDKFILGEFKAGEFTNTIELSRIFGTYAGDYNIKCGGVEVPTANTAGIPCYIDETNKQLIFNPNASNEEKTYELSITLNDVCAPVTRCFDVTLYSAIGDDDEIKNGGKTEEYNNTKYVIATPGTGWGTYVSGGGLYVEVSGTGLKTIKFMQDKPTATYTPATYYTIYVPELKKIEFDLGDDYNSYIIAKKDVTGDSSKTFIYDSTTTEVQGHWINLAHTAEDLYLKLTITIYVELDDPSTGVKAITYPSKELFIKLAKSYTLDSGYRAEGATFETIASGKTLATNSANGELSAQLFGYKASPVEHERDTRFDIRLVNRWKDVSNYTETLYVGEYDKLATELGFFDSNNPNHLVFTPSISAEYPVANEGDTQCPITWNDDGTLTFTYNELVAYSYVHISNKAGVYLGYYKFMVVPAKTKDGVRSDYGYVKYNSDLLQIDTSPNLDKPDEDTMEYISVTLKELRNESFKLATLKYAPSTAVAYINMRCIVNSKTYDIEVNQRSEVAVYEVTLAAGTDPESRTLLGSEDAKNVLSMVVCFGFMGVDVQVANYETIKADTFTLASEVVIYNMSIVTIDGCEQVFDLVISNFDVEYPRATESLYGGTEGYNILYGDRIILTNNGDNLHNTDEGVSTSFTASSDEPYIKYIGAIDASGISGVDIDGKSHHLALGSSITYKPNDAAAFVTWNSFTNTFGVGNVDDAGKNVALLFDVYNYDVAAAKYVIIGRVYYNVHVQNNLVIGMNPQLGKNLQQYDLYLGTDSYSNRISNKFKIDLINSYNVPLYKADGSVDQWGGHHGMFITLEMKSTGNTMYDADGEFINNALYNGSGVYDPDNKKFSSNKDDGNKTGSVYNTGSADSYLRFAVTNVSAGLRKDGKSDGEPLVTVSDKGILAIEGNPEGTFTLVVTAKNGSGYSKSFNIRVHQYYSVITRFNDSIDTNNSSGYSSGAKVNLYAGACTAEIGEGHHVIVNVLGASSVTGKAEKDVSWLPKESVKIYTHVFNEYYDRVNDSMKSADIGWELHASWYNCESAYQYELPPVKFSDNDNKVYQIVGVKITITRHNVTRDYYAFYKVYNSTSLNVNSKYIANDRVITYDEADGAWTEAGGQSTLTLLDTEGKGLYSSMTPLILEDSDTFGPSLFTGETVDDLVDDGQYLLVHSYTKAETTAVWGKNTYYYKTDPISLADKQCPPKTTLPYLEFYSYDSTSEVYTKIESTSLPGDGWYDKNYSTAGNDEYKGFYYTTYKLLETKPEDWDAVDTADSKKKYYTRTSTFAEAGTASISKCFGWYSTEKLIYNRDMATTYYKATFTPVTTIDGKAPEWKEGLYYTWDTNSGFYVLTSSAPANWNSTYGSYYVISGYTPITTDDGKLEYRDNYYYEFNDIYGLAVEGKLGVKLRVVDSTAPNGERVYDLSFEPNSYDTWEEGKFYKKEADKYKLLEEQPANWAVDGDPDYYTNFFIKIAPVGNKVTVTLPEGLFTNKAEMYIDLIDNGTTSVLSSKKWEIKSNVTIEAYDSRPLSDFFLQSEIGEDLYNTQVIGIVTDTTNTDYHIHLVYPSVSGNTIDSEEVEAKTLNSYYDLKTIKYSIGSAGGVFTITQQYKCLEGKGMAIKFNTTGSTITIDIDDDDLNGKSTGIINMSPYVSIASSYGPNWNTDKAHTGFRYHPVHEQSVKLRGGTYLGLLTLSTSDSNFEVIDNDTYRAASKANGDSSNRGASESLRITDVTQYANQKSVAIDLTFSVWMTGTDGATPYKYTADYSSTSRTIKVIFNFMINAKSFDADGKIPYSAGLTDADGLIPKALNGGTSLTITGNSNVELKNALLGLIIFDGNEISTNQNAMWDPNSVYNKFTKIEINVVTDGDGNPTGDYTLKYYYESSNGSYARTFTLKGTE